jgi:hypothetical protein
MEHSGETGSGSREPRRSGYETIRLPTIFNML